MYTLNWQIIKNDKFIYFLFLSLSIYYQQKIFLKKAQDDGIDANPKDVLHIKRKA